MTPEILQELCKVKMPFGKYKDQWIIDLPISYLEWFNRKGFPQNKLGSQLATIYEVKLNGLDHIFTAIRDHKKPEAPSKPRVYKL